MAEGQTSFGVRPATTVDLDAVTETISPAFPILESSNSANNHRYERLGFEGTGEFYRRGATSR